MPNLILQITGRTYMTLTQAGRIYEYFSACEMIVFGLTLLYPDDTFGSSKAWVGFIDLGLSENAVGGPALAVGAVWLTALYINGSWRRSPILRTVCAVSGGSFWWSVSGSFLSAHLNYGVPVTTAIGTYALIGLFTLFAGFRAAYDYHTFK